MGRFFGGYGEGKKGGPRKLYVGPDGELTEVPPASRRKGRVGIHGFKEFETAQLDKAQAEAIGAHWDPRDGITTVRSERSLKEHLARERAAGRDVRWREH